MQPLALAIGASGLTYLLLRSDWWAVSPCSAKSATSSTLRLGCGGGLDQGHGNLASQPCI